MLFTFFATAWQGANATDWATRLEAEQHWLIESIAPETIQEDLVYEEDSISTGQAAPTRDTAPANNPTQIEKVEYANPWDPSTQAPSYQPARKRSR